MRTFVKLSLLFLCALVLSACNISGSITDDAGDPVPGVTVLLTGPVTMETVTDSSGRYEFSGHQISNGDFRVTPVSDSYTFNPPEQAVSVKKKNIRQIDFEAIAAPATCEANYDCAAGMFCRKAVGDCDGAGRCVRMPEICTDDYVPVCGCDGKTYSNTCHAAASGVSVASDGECDGSTGQITIIESEETRDMDPDVTADELASIVNGNTDFALALYHQLCKSEQGNLFYSPYSISTALAMLYGGAANNTAQQMAATLNFTLPDETTHSGFNRLELELDSRGQGASGMDGGEFRLNVANAIWLQKGYPFSSTFLDLLAVNYGAGANLLDFYSAPEPCRLTINQWVAEKTEDRIPDLLPKGSIVANTRLVLTNAVYFNAAWAAQFEKANTQDEPFYPLDASPVTVPMMRQEASFKYTQGDTYKAVELPYDGRELSMVIIVPDSGLFAAVEATLDSAGVNAMLAGMTRTNLQLGLPQWEYKSKFNLNSDLTAMGMSDAFDPFSADFSGISQATHLVVTSVVHQAFVKVNENGTEAAAATGVVIGDSAAPTPEVVLTVDRPFIYFIRDIQTGTIVFVGRVIDPSE